jgi:hypothetical protein
MAASWRDWDMVIQLTKITIMVHYFKNLNGRFGSKAAIHCTP